MINPNVQTVLALLIIAGAVYLVVKRVDIRLVLFGAGLAMASLALKPWIIFDEFLREMGNGNTIGPICAAMGFAFVLRAIGADREMVRMLIAPIRRVRWLLVPGGVAVGFLTNVLAAIASSFGRTMSPVAAVVFFTSSLLNVTPIQIVKRTGPPLALAAAVVFAFKLTR